MADFWIDSDELLDRLAHIRAVVEEAQEWARSDSYGSVYEKVEELENHIQHLKAMWEEA